MNLARSTFSNGDAITRCQDVFRVTPKPLQLRVVECIGQGQDCTLIAGCGWGKTLVYFLPLVLWENRIIVVISPLEALMQEQLRELGIRSISLGGNTTIDSDKIEELAKGTFRAVFMTPEIIFDSRRLRQLWSTTTWQRQLQAIVLDESHYVSTWGPEFRKAYSRIGELRSMVAPGVAFIALSATLPPTALEDVKRSVYFKPEVTVINVGNDRPNVRFEVRHFNPKEPFKHLNFLMDFQKTIVYFESQRETVKAAQYLRTLTSSANKNKIALYYALMSEEYKSRIMEAFKQDEIKILLSTETAGMGCDIGDVIRVVQFKSPRSISSLVQRLGRAARNPVLQGFGILLIPPPSDNTKFADPHLALYINVAEKSSTTCLVTRVSTTRTAATFFTLNRKRLTRCRILSSKKSQ